jgi:hypothetical protein
MLLPLMRVKDILVGAIWVTSNRCIRREYKNGGIICCLINVEYSDTFLIWTYTNTLLMCTIIISLQIIFIKEKLTNIICEPIYHNYPHPQMYQYTLNKRCTEEFTLINMGEGELKDSNLWKTIYF